MSSRISKFCSLRVCPMIYVEIAGSYVFHRSAWKLQVMRSVAKPNRSEILIKKPTYSRIYQLQKVLLTLRRGFIFKLN
ncbi:hypothetical protein B7P43_G16512 [Cryptotermes secundus]|uniref:Uncharacterized protein n=1 Tax=Cryptotermes secundus TaxID=105785 RepID=A0A2J7QR77_9NEOP|nr:hypothetical protein B7P43_G16512 [Cryptotermes secundus]